jgi:hypothetical protein
MLREEMASKQLLATNGPANARSSFRLLSKRFSTRATHIQCCPHQPRRKSTSIISLRTSAAKRVRNATASTLSQVDALSNPDLATEQSCLNASLVPRGVPGSVRLDVVKGPLDNPTAVFDLKTGNATLTPARIQQIQSHLSGGNSVPVYQIKPQ